MAGRRRLRGDRRSGRLPAGRRRAWSQMAISRSCVAVTAARSCRMGHTARGGACRRCASGRRVSQLRLRGRGGLGAVCGRLSALTHRTHRFLCLGDDLRGRRRDRGEGALHDVLGRVGHSHGVSDVLADNLYLRGGRFGSSQRQAVGGLGGRSRARRQRATGQQQDECQRAPARMDEHASVHVRPFPSPFRRSYKRPSKQHALDAASFLAQRPGRGRAAGKLDGNA
jgi:hypothetical protein